MLISANTRLYSDRPGPSRWSHYNAIDFLAVAGFEAVDINLCSTILSDPAKRDPLLDGDDWRERILALRAYIARKGLKVTYTHLPFRHDLPHSLPYYRDPMMDRAIEASALLGAGYAVCHPERVNTSTSPARETDVAETIRAFTPLCSYASSLGVTLAMENLFSTSPEQLVVISDELHCAVCWDVGHANVGGFPLEKALPLLGKRIKALHLHDNYGLSDNHNAPYFGTVNWPQLVSLLREIDYKGTFNYEVSAPKIPEGLSAAHAAYLVKAARLLLS